MSFTKIVFASLVLVVAASFASAEVIGSFEPTTIGAADPFNPGGLSGYAYRIQNNEDVALDSVEIEFTGDFTQSQYGGIWYSPTWADTMFALETSEVTVPPGQSWESDSSLGAAFFMGGVNNIQPGESAIIAYLVTDTVPTASNFTGGMPLVASNGELFNVVPEPASMTLLGIGGLALLRRRRNRK